MALPTLTEEQRQAALEKAAVARRARAEITTSLKSGTLTLAEVFQQAVDAPDGAAGRLKVFALLRALPGYGQVRAKKLMDDVHIAETRRVRGLGDQQKKALLAVIQGG
jgi:hypothetical protein